MKASEYCKIRTDTINKQKDDNQKKKLLCFIDDTMETTIKEKISEGLYSCDVYIPNEMYHYNKTKTIIEKYYSFDVIDRSFKDCNGNRITLSWKNENDNEDNFCLIS